MTECVDCAFCAPLTDAERDQIFQALLEIVGPRGLVTAPDEIAAASLDSRRRRQGSALALVRAASTEEVSAVVRLAGEWGLCIVPQCGNTSTVGGATPEPESPANRRTIILSLSRMNRILSVDPVNAAMTVEAGVILAKAAEAAAKQVTSIQFLWQPKAPPRLAERLPPMPAAFMWCVTAWHGAAASALKSCSPTDEW